MQPVEIGDWIKDRSGLPFRGKVESRVLIGGKIPGFKVWTGDDRYELAVESEVELWFKAE